jgi:hypothetical protein
VNESQEREVRQLSLMKGALDNFSCGEISISTAIGTLKSLCWELEDVGEDWRADFHRKWLLLEIENASALSNGLPLPDATNPLLREAVSQMWKMVTSQISRHAES